MSGNVAISAGVTTTKQQNTLLSLEGKGPCTSRLEEYLDTRSLVAFSHSCKAAKRMANNALSRLLSAVVHGDEKEAKRILNSCPELLLVKSATTKDFSGKQITGLSALQAAICAGDVEMINMIKNVLLQKRQLGICLSFEPDREIPRQFEEIYPEGMDAVEKHQKDQAQTFKDYTLNEIFVAINASKDAYVKYELDKPGQVIIATEEELKFQQENPGIISERRILNVALNNFRAYVDDLSNRDQIFNAFYLLAAYEVYGERFDDFAGKANSEAQWNRRDVFYRLVIGYIQRHLPACYLQAFASPIVEVVKYGSLKRDFKFKNRPDMFPGNGGFRLGYEYEGMLPGEMSVDATFEWVSPYKQLLQIKKSCLKNLCSNRLDGSSFSVATEAAPAPVLPSDQVRNAVSN